MNIEIKYIKDAGDIDNERIVLMAKDEDDIGHYIIFDTTYLSDGQVSNKMQHPYWFPDKIIKANDKVVVYTKRGTDKSKINDNDTETHFFYRDLEKSIWNKKGDCAVIFDIREWAIKPV